MSDFYRQLPAKRMGAGVLFLNEWNQVLLVEPAYKAGWEIPGGIVELGESPQAAAVREVREELGLQVSPAALTLIVVDYMAGNNGLSEALMFVFYGGVLDQCQQDVIKLDENELKSCRFIDVSEVTALLTEPLAGRVLRSIDAVQTGRVSYADRRY